MKTAISIPDDLFADAERLARVLKKSRSRLCGDAVREYVARHSADRVTETVDRDPCRERARLRRDVLVPRARRVGISRRWRHEAGAPGLSGAARAEPHRRGREDDEGATSGRWGLTVVG